MKREMYQVTAFSSNGDLLGTTYNRNPFTALESALKLNPARWYFRKLS